MVADRVRALGSALRRVVLVDALAHRLVHPLPVRAGAPLGVVADQDGLASREPLADLVRPVVRSRCRAGVPVGLRFQRVTAVFESFGLVLQDLRAVAVGVVDLDLDLVSGLAQGLGRCVDRPSVGHAVARVAEPDHAEGREELEAAVLPLADDLAHTVALAGAVDERAVLVRVLDSDHWSPSSLSLSSRSAGENPTSSFSTWSRSSRTSSRVGAWPRTIS